jgi:PAS domain S-box-containing protein
MPGSKHKPLLPPDVMEAYLELSKDCIAMYNLDGVLEYCNPANLKVFGYGQEDLCGLNFAEMPFLGKDQLENVQGLFNVLKEKGEIDPVEIEVVRKDGEKIWVEVNTTLLKRDGKPFGIQSVTRNISARKEISRKLGLAQITLERYADGVFWINKGFTLFDVNASACDSLEYSREELLSMSVPDFDSHFTLPELEDLWEELKNKGSKRFESILKKKSGEIFPVDITANYIEFEGKEFLVAFTHDITNRKLAEAAILKSENEFRKIFENVVDVFYEASLDGNLINVTPSVERLTSYSRDELIGKPMVLFYYDPGVRDELLKELRKKGSVSNFELEIQDKDGSPIPAVLSSRIICDEGGKPVSIVGSISDMTHRKKAEDKIRQLSTALEQSPVPVIISDTSFKVLYVNNSFTSFSGLKPDEIIGTTSEEITRGQISMSDNIKMEEVLRSGNIYRDEIEYTNSSTEQLWLSITVSPIMDEQDDISHYVVILEDITKRKAYEKSLKTAKESAEESDRLKSAFLANMSHEIRTPMNAILGFSSLLKEQEVSQNQQSYYVDIINSKGRDLLRIISDIIDISRIETGDLYFKTEPIEIFSFIREIFDEFKEDARLNTRSNLQFRLNIPAKEKPVIVNTDSSRLKQIFSNLIQNAFKFTPDGFIEIGFELLEQNNIRMFVRDTGIGIPKDKQTIIFERFRQIDESHTRQYGGTGLGLAICLNLVKRMGGELKVKSSERQGSEFQFSLKYILTQAPKKGDSKDKSIHEVKLDLSGRRILIVEDDGASYLFLETLLKRYKPEISWAKNGKQAISIINKPGKFDVILMDIRMPEMNGLDATREIRKENPDIPIIAQTAYAQVSDRKAALESGCSDYISKPISPVELKSILIKYFNPQ